MLPKEGRTRIWVHRESLDARRCMAAFEHSARECSPKATLGEVEVRPQISHVLHYLDGLI